MLSFKNISLSYDLGDSLLKAIESLTLDVKKGEALSILGPSGCGKSSALRIASGLIKPTSGQVLVDGSDIKAPRKKTALVLQDFGLLPWKNVVSNAELGAKISGLPKNEGRNSALSALKQVGLAGYEKMYPSQLSGGMRQRLSLARALADEVDLMLLDEPLSALDAILREELQDLLLRLWKERGYTQVLVTHSIEEAVFLGSRIVILTKGPARVIDIIDNPMMGDTSYRLTSEYFKNCSKARELLGKGDDA